MRVLIAGGLGIMLAALVGAAGCSSPAPACQDENHRVGVAQLCAGLPPGDACASVPCTESASCAGASDDASLASSLAAASAGSCVTLSSGTYGDVVLPAGVSLYGSSADDVKLKGLTIGAGDGSKVHGVEVDADGIVVQTGATGVVIEQVRVQSSTSDGISIAAGASVTVQYLDVVAAGQYGIFASDATVTLTRVYVAQSEGPGLWAQDSSCAMSMSTTCPCGSLPGLTVTESVFYQDRILGISTIGVSSTLATVDIRESKGGDQIDFGQYGGGLSVSDCSTFSATKLRVLDSDDWGILVDNSKALLGGDNAEDGPTITNNLRGVWVQNVTQDACNLHLNTPMDGCVELHNGNLTDNNGVSIGVDGDSHGVIICVTGVQGTHLTTLPVYNAMDLGDAESVGDGFNWLGQSDVMIDHLTLSGSERQSFIVDGPVGMNSDTITELDQTGETKPGVLKEVFLQNYTMGPQPTISDGSSTVSAPAATRTYSIAQDLAAPTGS